MEQKSEGQPGLNRQFEDIEKFENDEIDLRHLWRTFLRYKKIVIYACVIFLFLASVISLLARPVYTASTLIEINKEASSLIKFKNEENEQSNFGDDFLVTQLSLLKSSSVAEDVVTNLGLVNEQEFNGELRQRSIFSGISSLLEFFFSGKSDLSEKELINNAVERYQGKLTVSPIRKSSLVKVSFTSLKPESAVHVLNKHIESYIKFSDKRRFNSALRSKAFLEQEIINVKSALEKSGKKLTNFARKNGVIDVFAIENGSTFVERRNDIMMTQLNELTISLAKVQDERIDAQTKNNNGNRFKQLSKHQESLQATIKQLKNEILDLQDREIAYNILKREWEANQQLYSAVLERANEEGVAEGIQLNVASIVDAAKTPKSASSNLLLNLVLGCALGLFAGTAVAFVLAILDNSINDAEQLIQLSKVPVLGVLPFIDSASSSELSTENKANLSLIDDVSSPYTEGIQSIRMSLLFTETGVLPKSVMVTSAAPLEGKSTITTNLAISLAKSGKKVILLEADLRKSKLYKTLDVSPSPGLVDKLANYDDALVTHSLDEISGLSISVAGTRTSNPVELLSSEHMRKTIDELEEQYDIVLIDCPSVIGLVDSSLLSQLVESVIFVVSAHTTGHGVVENALRSLNDANAPIIGTIFNNFKPNLSRETYDYYSYYGVDESQS